MKKIAIVGAGVAGMATGIYAQKSGFQTIICEKNPLPGGECTGWDRQGYHIDGCIHWLTGTREGTPLRRMWEEVGALDGVAVHQPDSFWRFYHPDGDLTFWRDLERTEEELCRAAPEDEARVREMCAAIRTLEGMEIPSGKPMDMMNPLELCRLMASMARSAAPMQKYGKLSVAAFAGRFQNPALRAMMGHFLPPGYAASALLFSLATFTGGNGDVPAGGSRALALRMAERYRALGGELRLSCPVEEVWEEGGRARGLVLAGGERLAADWTVAACDAHFALHRLLGGRHPAPAWDRRFAAEGKNPRPTSVRAAFGVAADLRGWPRTLGFLVEPLSVGTQRVEHLGITQYSDEPTFAPAGQTVMVCNLDQSAAEDYPYWQSLARDRTAYRAEKARLLGGVRRRVEGQFPELAGKLLPLDLATPVTYHRWCSAYQGAWMSFVLTPGAGQMAADGRVKGLKNALLASQWCQTTGGLPIALICGSQAVRRICRAERVPFAGGAK
ncbi:NAD(P)/FAD-dependent oxidoreductase [Bittarella massiliensis]|uniref:phytoene desaturase family protein n=1 Tax=Bittarella massiliensis (ex Durand et al. 2017) TaxID=1720313 RepID=UPI00163B74FE|nr:NAD(P)/FAD-dependent oxidoreductase [Bittarella massiliensis (ex Durand et al. 2017)]